MIEQQPTTRPTRESATPESRQPEEIRKPVPKKRIKLEKAEKVEKTEKVEKKKGSSSQYKRHKPLLLLRQKGMCTFCSTLLGEFNTQVDHIIPKRFEEIYGKDKINSPENLHAICCECHNIKSWKVDKSIQSFVTANTAFSTTFEDAIGHVTLYMNRKHDEERKKNKQKMETLLARSKDRTNSMGTVSGKRKERDSGYLSDFSAKSYDSDLAEDDAEVVDLEEWIKPSSPLPPPKSPIRIDLD